MFTILEVTPHYACLTPCCSAAVACLGMLLIVAIYNRHMTVAHFYTHEWFLQSMIFILYFAAIIKYRMGFILFSLTCPTVAVAYPVNAYKLKCKASITMKIHTV